MNDSSSLSELSKILNDDDDGHLLAEFLKKKSGKVITRRIFEENSNRLSISVQVERADDEEKKSIEGTPEKRVANASPVRVCSRSPLQGYLKRTSGTSNLRRSCLKRAALYNQRNLLDSFNDFDFDPPLTSSPLLNQQENDESTENIQGATEKTRTEIGRIPNTNEKVQSSREIALTLSPLRNQNKELGINGTYTKEQHGNDNNVVPECVNDSLLESSPLLIQQGNIENNENTPGTIDKIHTETEGIPNTNEKVQSSRDIASTLSSLRSQNRELGINGTYTKEQHGNDNNALQECLNDSLLESSPLLIQQGNIENNGNTHDKIHTETEGISNTNEKVQSSKEIALTLCPLRSQNRELQINGTYTKKHHGNDNNEKPDDWDGSENLTEIKENSQKKTLKTRTTQTKGSSTSTKIASEEAVIPRTQTSAEEIQNESRAMNTESQNNQKPFASPTRRHKKQGLSKKKRTKLVDTFTSEEEGDNESRAITSHDENHSEPNRVRKLRKRRVKNRAAENKTNATPTTANKFQPKVLQKCLPLNKPPRTPINGEKFADELKKQLAGLNNRKALDLRRHKSNSFKKDQSSAAPEALPLDKQKIGSKSSNAPSENLVTADQNQNEDGDSHSEDDVNNLIAANTNPNDKDLNNDDPLPSQSNAHQVENQDVASAKDSQNDCPPSVQLCADRFEKQTHNIDNENGVENEYLSYLQLNEVQIEKEVLEGEQSSERVSFVPKATISTTSKNKRTKSKRNKPANDLYTSYVNAAQRMKRSSKKANESKRSLYSENIDESDLQTRPISPVEIIPPPPMFRASTSGNSELPNPAESAIQNKNADSEDIQQDDQPSSSRKRLISNPAEFAIQNKNADSEYIQQEDEPSSSRKRLLPLPTPPEPSIQNKDSGSEGIPPKDSFVFKKPIGVPKKRKKITQTLEINEGGVEGEGEGQVRRSQRDRKPSREAYIWKLLQENYNSSKSILKSHERNLMKLKQSRVAQKSKINNTENEIVPLASSTALAASASKRGRPKKTEENLSSVLSTITETSQNSAAITNSVPSSSKTRRTKIRNKLTKIPENEDLPVLPEISETSSGTQNVSKALENNNTLSSNINSTEKCKNFRIKLQRCNLPVRERTTGNDPPHSPSISSSMSPSTPFSGNLGFVHSTPQFDFVNWLKEATPTPTSSDSNLQSFKQMSFSTHSDLVFKDVNNVEYAFYKTKTDNCGYIRLSAGQRKPYCRIKKPVHFIILAGSIELDNDGDIAYSTVGDLVILNAGSRYSIKNIGDDVCIILFIRN